MKKLTNKNLGPKYGLKIRQQYIRYYNFAHNSYTCINCNFGNKVKRQLSGIWLCKKCGYKFVGRAYHPYSEI